MNTQANNTLVAHAQAELDAKKREQNRKRVATGTNGPAPTPTPTTAASDAVLVALMARLDALEAENKALKSAKPAGKAEKPANTLENESVSIDGDIMTIKIDLRKDTGKDIASKARKIVATSGAFGFHNLVHKGVRFSLSCQVYHDNPNFDELDKAYKAAKKSAK